MYTSRKVICKSMTTRVLLPLLISLFAGHVLYGQEVAISPNANPLDPVELLREEKNMVRKQSWLRWKEKNPNVPDSKFNYVEPKVFSEWNDTYKNLKEAQKNLKKASSSDLPKKSLKQLEGTKKTLATEIERARISLKNHQSKITARDESLARDYTVRKASEIKNKRIALGNLEKKFLNQPVASPARIRASSDARAAKRELLKLTPGEQLSGRGGDYVLRDPLKVQYTKAGMKERAKRQRAYLNREINLEKKKLVAKKPQLETVEQQITAIKNQNAAQQMLDKATGPYLAANQKLLVTKTAAQVDIAKEKLAERQATRDQKRGLLQGPKGSGAKVQNGMAAYDELRIVPRVFKDVFKLLAQIFDEQDKNNALERGIKAIEEIEKRFPPLKEVKKDSDGHRYLPDSAPNKKLRQLAKDFNTMVLDREKLDKAWKNIRTAEENLRTAEENLRTAEENLRTANRKYAIARRQEILRELEAMPRNAEALKLRGRRRELLIELGKLR